MNFMLKPMKGFTIAVTNRIDIFFFHFISSEDNVLYNRRVCESMILKVVLLLLRQSSSNLGSEKLFKKCVPPFISQRTGDSQNILTVLGRNAEKFGREAFRELSSDDLIFLRKIR